MPPDWPTQLGGGFSYTPEGKIKTKYSSGTALAQLPFFLLAHGIASFGDDANGVSYLYHLSLYLAGVFYLLVGLYFLFRFLRTRYDLKATLMTLVVLLLGTNLYYYAFNSPGYSHIYSFAGYAFVLWLSHSISANFRPAKLILLVVLASWLLLIRPTSILYLFFIWWYFPELRRRIFKVWSFNKRLFFGAFLAGCIVWIPQILYWYYLSGSPIYYSYEQEGFGWPQLHKLWFSTNNGLFVYAPVLIFAVVGLFLQFRNQHKQEAIKIGVMWLVVSLVFSSWWSWWYGCSYGSRSFVEFLIPLSIPFCFFIQQTVRSNKTSIKWFVGVILLLLIVINLKIIYKYDDCFHGTTWDATAYFKLIF